jgi:hypothetical protein
LQLSGMSPAEAGALPVSLVKSVREPHNATRLTAVLQTVSVPQLVDRLRCRAMYEALPIGRMKSSSREDRYAATSVSLPEYEVQIWCVEIDACDPEQS